MFQRRQTRFILALVATVTLSAITAPAEAIEVTFPDANLEARVKSRLGILQTEPITDTEMQALTILYAYEMRIANIQGLEYGTNLDRLTLRLNQISDISPLAGLTNLTNLDLQQNRVSDISAVAGLTNLTNLYLSFNRINDISAVAGLTDLNTLALRVNQISDISPLAALTDLNSLALSSNQISDISSVAGLTKLKSLWLDNNQFSDISPVAGMTDLTELFLSMNQISDISPVAEMTDLTYLSLQRNQISNISAVAGLVNLTGLNLSFNQISDVSPAAGLTNLTQLILSSNQIETMDLNSADLSSLTAFGIGNNPLTSVLLAGAAFSQPSFYALMDGRFSGHTGIAELSGVLNLDMSGVDFGPIADLSAMYNMDDLETLLLERATNLDGSQVVTLTGELDSLNWLDVTGLWDEFDPASQDSLRAWGAVEGHTLVVPEPGSFALLLCGAIGLLAYRRRRRR